MTDTTLPPDTVRKCLSEIFEACGYESDEDLAEALRSQGWQAKSGRAVVNSWRPRNSWGRGIPARLHDLTGAALDWLHGRGEVAFPNGPTINPGISSAKMWGDITELRRQVSYLAVALAETKRDVAEAWYKSLNSRESDYYRSKGFRSVILAALQRALDQSARDVQVQAKRDRAKQNRT